MRVALSNVPPDIKGICARSQAQISHRLLNKYLYLRELYCAIHSVLFHTVI